jgi:hypothetical protein
LIDTDADWTVMVVEAEREFVLEVAVVVMTAVPLPTAVTSPSASTVATAWLLDV